MKKIGLLEIKAALRDGRFRDSLPQECKIDIVKFMENPSCACNVPFYRKLLKEYRKYLEAYYPDCEIVNEDETMKKMAQNHWKVINCHVDKLENELRNLGHGRKQVAISRWEDQCTVIIDELEELF